ncbi:homoserine O-succinyltransferase [Planktomarina temperata]|nr:homoserine O-succinyltransferase [bacterium]MDA8875285.1 homoserine O-succinyltransferase [Planktomarina temperata]MDB0044489.1 homoserine O-succinyltransferase [Planktomarina temperata]MDB0071281.1 homoserine O-succinyltransferase [Planktomarina temperata]MDB4199840.1 homoserine O-succinyltransferase [Planktomarina temperata]
MPIKIPANLPAHAVLSAEGVMVMDPSQADRQDIRPLRIALLNLMPLKIQTENQFARLIGATPLQIELTLLRMTSHQTKNTSSDHMEQFYKPFSAVWNERFDGLIITGAPIEHLDFQDVTYWPEMVEVMEWTQSHVHATLGVCWGGMAMINHLHGVKKHDLPQKAFGCFRHQNLDPSSPYLRGFSDDFVVPVSRWTEMKQDEIAAVPGLKTLLGSSETGPCLVEDPAHHALYLFNHFEYDSNTLKQEYDRDIANGTPINIPGHYYPGDDPSQTPLNRWRSHAHLLYGNWINEIYQTTPFDRNAIGR